MREEVIAEGALLRDAIAAIENGRKTIAVMVDHEGRLLGTVTDGDIRRAILRNLPIDTPAREVVTREPVTVLDGVSMEEAARLLSAHGLEALPVVDEGGKFLRTIFIESLTNFHGSSCAASALWGVVIMAGGEGRRMMPHTRHTPKPMLKVGGMPIMERNVRSLIRLGAKRFFLSINYLGHIIEEYFDTGGSLGVSIEYLRETEPLGTAGAVRMIDPPPAGPVLVMNGDLLTGLDIGRLLSFHVKRNAYLTVAAKEYVIEVPFGVLRTRGDMIEGLVEKPSERFLCNAGIYVLSAEVFRNLPAKKAFNMTDVIEAGITSRKQVTVFPMFELWKDVGTPQQWDEACKLAEIGKLRV
jgi:dTDP-glucose pyrophosphorylase